MGGVWERVIRSVRKILRALLGEQIVYDESLRTLTTEVQGILNSRPLEYLPTLDERNKWLNPRRSLATGDPVLIADENFHRRKWPLGRVLGQQELVQA